MCIEPTVQWTICFTPIYLWAVVQMAGDLVDGVARRAVNVVECCACQQSLLIHLALSRGLESVNRCLSRRSGFSTVMTVQEVHCASWCLFICSLWLHWNKGTSISLYWRSSSWLELAPVYQHLVMVFIKSVVSIFVYSISWLYSISHYNFDVHFIGL